MHCPLLTCGFLVLSLPPTSLFLPLSASRYLTPLTLYCQGCACFILPLCFALPLFLILERLVFSARLFCVCSVSLSIPQRVFISTINKKRLKTHLLRNFNHHFFLKKNVQLQMASSQKSFIVNISHLDIKLNHLPD